MKPPTQENVSGSLEEASGIMPQEPPAVIAHAIAWLLIAIFFTALVAAFTVHVPETLNCRFVLVPKEGAESLQSPGTGAMSHIRVTEGDEVAAGAELFVLRSGGKLTSVRAPYHAVVISLPPHTVGAEVQAGEELCQLAHAGETPEARLVIPESGFTGLAKARSVRLFFDAFPYQRYGTVTGKIDWISAAEITTPEGQNFVALVSLDQASVRADGASQALRMGMKGEAHIITGSRALIEYVFDPIRQLRENMHH